MRRFGPYILEQEIARGGMGVVYRGVAESGERVAVKLLFEPDPRFEQEGRALAALDHPGIVGFREALTDAGGRQALVMEWVEGESLRDLLRRKGPLPVERAVALLGELCEAVEHAHARGVIHRDLKPHNVLVDRRGRPRLTDFGLGKVSRAARPTSRASLTRTGEIMGTPGYMPPEQVEGDRRRVGPRSDVYGLGATLYAMLTGRAPFRGPTVMNTLNAVLEYEPERPSALRGEVTPGLEAVVLRCLAKQPEARYPSAASLGKALRALTSGVTPAEPAARPVRVRSARSSRARWLAALVLFSGVATALAIVARRSAPSTSPVTQAPSAAPVTPPSSAPTPTPPTPVDDPTPSTPSRLEADDLLEQAQGLLASGHPEEALDVLSVALDAQTARAAQPDPGTPAARLRGALHEARGQALLALGEASKARSALDEAIALHDDPDLRFQRARVSHLHLDDHRNADADLLHLLRSLPDAHRLRSAVHELRAHVLARLADLNDASGQVDRARDERTEALRSLMAVSTARTRGRARLRGDLLRGLGRFDDALEAYDDELELGDDPGLRMARATTRERLGQSPQALTELDRAVELDPDLAVARIQRGQYRQRQGDSAGALEDFERALDKTSWPEQHLWLGVARARVGEVAGAVDAWEQVPALSPKRRVADMLLEQARSTLGADGGAATQAGARLARLLEAVLHAERGEVDAALQAHAAVLRDAPTLARVHLQRAILFMSQHAWSDAEAASTAAIEHADDPLLLAEALGIRREIRAELGDVDGARGDLERVVEVAPSSPQLHLLRAQAYLGLDDLENALAAGAAAARDAPSWGRAWQVLGRIHERRGDRTAAISAYDNALRSRLPPSEHAETLAALKRVLQRR